MVHFKLCLRCNGDVVSKQDTYGSFYQCLHCGNIMEVDFVHTLARVNSELEENERKVPASSDSLNFKEITIH